MFFRGNAISKQKRAMRSGTRKPHALKDICYIVRLTKPNEYLDVF